MIFSSFQPPSNYFLIIAWLDGWGAAMIGGLMGGFFALLIMLFTNDFNARKACCNILYELRLLLEKLIDYARNRNGGQTEYYYTLKNMERMVEQLDVEVAGLCFRPSTLDELIFKSLELFRILDPDHENPNFRPAFTASNLIQLWAPSKRLKMCPKQIVNCQKFLKKSFVSRAWSGRFFNHTFKSSKVDTN